MAEVRMAPAFYIETPFNIQITGSIPLKNHYVLDVAAVRRSFGNNYVITHLLTTANRLYRGSYSQAECGD